MSLIYEPKGKAREYSPLALNIYSGGCDHACEYCYCRNIFKGQWCATPRVRNLSSLAKEAAKASRQILLSFVGDPYCAAEDTHRKTREALKVLMAAECSVAILTKGGTRCLRDLDIFKAWPDGRIKVGATLTFCDPADSTKTEPGAASPGNRLHAMKELHGAGVKTWASIEPVIDARQSLGAIKASLPFVGAYKVGKLNHRTSDVDWAKFAKDAIFSIREAGRLLYVKHDLRPFCVFPLTEQETNIETLTLPDRP